MVTGGKVRQIQASLHTPCLLLIDSHLSYPKFSASLQWVAPTASLTEHWRIFSPQTGPVSVSNMLALIGWRVGGGGGSNHPTAKSYQSRCIGSCQRCQNLLRCATIMCNILIIHLIDKAVWLTSQADVSGTHCIKLYTAVQNFDTNQCKCNHYYYLNRSANKWSSHLVINGFQSKFRLTGPDKSSDKSSASFEWSQPVSLGWRLERIVQMVDSMVHDKIFVSSLCGFRCSIDG